MSDTAELPPVSNITGTQIAITFFPNFAAPRKSEAALTLPDLAERIRATTAPHKEMLPWLKLARFGNKRTDKGSLRHDANMLAISGIEADYDAGRMPFEDACALLEKQGIASIPYTSPSHTEDVPRWRVLCPLSIEMPPARRSALLGRLNGLFGGIFSNESWTLSQFYYFGSVNRNPSHHVEVIEGQPIDLHDDLDVIWRDKPGGAKTATPSDQHVNAETREDAELIRCVVTGEHLHVELTALAARYVGRNIPPDTVEEMLRGMMLSHPEGARDERWLDRYYSIPELVASALKKYRDEQAAKQRPLFRLARQLVREDRPPEEVRARVAAEAAARGFGADVAARSIAWASKLEIACVEAANA